MATKEIERGRALGHPSKLESCCNCGMEFMMPDMFYRVKYSDHTKFYCPAGHPQSYVEGKTERQIQRERVEIAETMLGNDILSTP